MADPWDALRRNQDLLHMLVQGSASKGDKGKGATLGRLTFTSTNVTQEAAGSAAPLGGDIPRTLEPQQELTAKGKVTLEDCTARFKARRAQQLVVHHSSDKFTRDLLLSAEA